MSPILLLQALIADCINEGGLNNIPTYLKLDQAVSGWLYCSRLRGWLYLISWHRNATESFRTATNKHDHNFWCLWQIMILRVYNEWVKIVCHYLNPMMHRKQVSTRSYESDTNDRPFSVWVLTILTSEACHHSAELRAPHTQTSIHPHTDTDHGVTRGSLSPLTRCVQSSPPHQPQPTRSDIAALIWTILPCQPLKSWL